MSFLGSSLSLLFMLLSFVAMCLCGAVAGFGMFYFASSSNQMASFGLGEVGIMLAISGGSMFMIKFMGLCGTAMESKWLTRIFYIFLCIGLVLQGASGIVTLVREAKVNSMAEKAWMNASELSREVIQKRHLCCGFYDPAEDVRCAHLYPESCGERLIEVQSSSLKLISALIFLATMIDIFLLVIGIFLAKIYSQQEAKEKSEREARQRVTKTQPLKP